MHKVHWLKANAALYLYYIIELLWRSLSLNKILSKIYYRDEEPIHHWVLRQRAGTAPVLPCWVPSHCRRSWAYSCAAGSHRRYPKHWLEGSLTSALSSRYLSFACYCLLARLSAFLEDLLYRTGGSSAKPMEANLERSSVSTESRRYNRSSSSRLIIKNLLNIDTYPGRHFVSVGISVMVV